MIERSYRCHVGKFDYDDPIWMPIPIQHFMGSNAGEIAATEALDHGKCVAQIFLEFRRVDDGVLTDPIGCHFSLLATTPFNAAYRLNVMLYLPRALFRTRLSLAVNYMRRRRFISFLSVRRHVRS